MATFKGNGVLTGMVGNLVIANYKSGKAVLRKAPRERKIQRKTEAKLAAVHRGNGSVEEFPGFAGSADMESRRGRQAGDQPVYQCQCIGIQHGGSHH
jgi:hypothetical protein